MKRPPLNERLIAGLEAVLAGVKLDEQTDLPDETPDTPENPDEKTSSKNKKSKSNQNSGSNLTNKHIEAVEAAWRENKSKASDDPEETVMENIEMTKASIKSIVKHANGLMMGLNETNQSCLSEGWVASKITIIEDYLRTIHDYVMYYEEEKEDEEEGDD